MLEAIAPEGLWDLMSRYDDRRATVTCTLGVMDLKCARLQNIFEPSRAPWFLREGTSSTARRVGIASFNRMDFQKRSGSSSSRNRLKFRIDELRWKNLSRQTFRQLLRTRVYIMIIIIS